mgnify:CR=1 FL=1|jgi:adenine-specific DNA-methyltransferase
MEDGRVKIKGGKRNMENKDRISKLNILVNHFKSNIDQYKSQSYDEANTRVDFIDKFFELLDWDVRNVEGYSEDYREVVREDKVVIEGKPKAPDYSFRIGGIRKFFVEAKKPSVNIKEDVDPAFQVRRYAYTAKLPLSILTDFEEFAVYDTRIKPSRDDRASIGRVFYCTFDEYEKNFDFIFDTFSKNAILKGSFDKYVAENKNKKGTSEVDREFLKMIEEWRSDLARSIALRNKDLEDVYALNTAVQTIIDRIIFLRIAEDRRMEEYGCLKAACRGSGVYRLLDLLFRQADEKYNSGLFSVEEWISNLAIDDKIISSIVNGLYYPDCPYELSVLPIEILGQIYEQFLGKTIRLTAGHQAKIEEKPEVRKAGGVYYTPQYIVNYIVEHTVGAKIKGYKPEEIESLRVLDPACGSGSFLVGAYHHLLGYHLEYYTDAKRIKKSVKVEKIYQVSENTYRLSTEEKRKILLNNIYGVDIDHQAVEVTKLSLLLKLMEDENVESAGKLFKHSHEKLLPDLSENIKCGNSLIGSDFYDDKNMSLFDKEELRKVNVFDWKERFPVVFRNGGFDCVIGNPPYSYILAKEEQAYYENQYKHQDYQKDLYLLFLERYYYLLKESGFLGVIISNTWLQSLTFKSIRRYLTSHYHWLNVLHIPEKVFNAVVDTHVIVFEKSRPRDVPFNIEIMKNGKATHSHSLSMNEIPFNGDPINIVSDRISRSLIAKIEKFSVPLSTVFKVYNGVKPFEKGKGNPPQSDTVMKEKPFVREGDKPGPEWKPLLRGSLIRRYKNLWDNNYWVLYGEWLAAPRDPVIFEEPLKIMVRQTGDSIIATIVESGFIARNNIHIIISPDNIYNIKYLLGLLNSRLTNFYYSFINPEKGEALAEVKKEHVEKLAIKHLDLSSNDKDKHDRLVSLVDQMLATQKDLHSAKTDADKKTYQQKADLIDRQIDKLVYELYSLTDEEIAIVEGKE